MGGILYVPKVSLIVKLIVSLSIWFILGLKLVYFGKNIIHCRSASCVCDLKKNFSLPATDPEYVAFS